MQGAYNRMRYQFRPRQERVSGGTGARSTSSSAIRRRRESKPPLAIELLKHPESIDPQSNSPLFSKLPRELREQIWRLALTRYEDSDILYTFNRRYVRPGQAAPWRVAVNLLLTCRAIYVEAFLKPFQVNPIVVFDGDPEDMPPDNLLTRSKDDPLLCIKLKSWQFANITSVDMSVQQFALEGGAVERVSRLIGTSGRHKGHESRGYSTPGYAAFSEPLYPNDDENLRIGRKITHLTIRLGRTDWWTWETPPEECERNPSDRLRLEPMINVTHMPAEPAYSLAMTNGYEARKLGNEPDFELDDFEKQGRWGMQVGEYWPDLTSLELVLETFACKEDQLAYVAKCAKLWTFPLEDGFHLAWSREEAFRWQGARSYGRSDSHRNWFKEQNRARGPEVQDPPLIHWRPAIDITADSQEFVVRTLVFERRRDSNRSEDPVSMARPSHENEV